MVKINALNQQNVLRTMLALQRFSVVDIAAGANVVVPTVRSILSRLKRKLGPILIEVGTEETLGRGQPTKLFEIHPDVHAKIRTLLGSPIFEKRESSDDPPARLASKQSINSGNFALLDILSELLDDAEEASTFDERDNLIGRATTVLQLAEVAIQKRETAGLKPIPMATDRISEMRLRRRNLALKGELEHFIKSLVHRTASKDWLRNRAIDLIATTQAQSEESITFFGALSIARARLEPTQNTVIDEFLYDFQPGKDAQIHLRVLTDQQQQIQARVAVAVGDVVRYALEDHTWSAYATSAVEGLEYNAVLSTSPAVCSALDEISDAIAAGDGAPEPITEPIKSFLLRYGKRPAPISDIGQFKNVFCS
ncbi:MAG: hypothetical protein WAZ27_00365 [Minisyncoccia bacterium]